MCARVRTAAATLANRENPSVLVCLAQAARALETDVARGFWRRQNRSGRSRLGRRDATVAYWQRHRTGCADARSRDQRGKAIRLDDRRARVPHRCTGIRDTYALIAGSSCHVTVPEKSFCRIVFTSARRIRRIFRQSALITLYIIGRCCMAQAARIRLYITGQLLRCTDGPPHT